MLHDAPGTIPCYTSHPHSFLIINPYLQTHFLSLRLFDRYPAYHDGCLEWNHQYLSLRSFHFFSPLAGVTRSGRVAFKLKSPSLFRLSFILHHPAHRRSFSRQTPPSTRLNHALLKPMRPEYRSTRSARAVPTQHSISKDTKPRAPRTASLPPNIASSPRIKKSYTDELLLKKQVRHRMTDEQLLKLESLYTRDTHPTTEEKYALGMKIKL